MLRPEKVCPVVRKTRHRIRGAGCAVYFDFTVEIRNMFHYICKDLMNSLRFLPFGIFAGLVCLLLFSMWNARRKRGQKKEIPVVVWTLFFTYLALILMITLWSRESGSQKGLDLELFSTWGINKRNNAYVIENVLLFIPYGVLCPLAFRAMGKFIGCLAVGAMTSLSVELLQLITGRGFFQIDNILTNICGTVIGFLVFFFFRRISGKLKKRQDSGK